MLVGALSGNGQRGASDAIGRVCSRAGRTSLRLAEGGGVVAGWDSPASLHESPSYGWVAEGWIELEAGEITSDSLRRSRGDFALLAFCRGGLLLASGRAGGHRPIYVASPSRDLIVASTRLAALLPLLPEQPPLDMTFMSDCVLSSPPQPEATPYRGVQKLPQGEAWLLRVGERAERWHTVPPLLEMELRDDCDLALRLQEAITASIRRSVRGVSRVGVEVSGGLDSSFIFSILCRLAREGCLLQPEAIACEYAAPSWADDRPYLRSLEQHLGAHVHRVTPTDAARWKLGTWAIDAMPASSPILLSVPPVGSVAREVGVEVILTGDGGDEVLDGDPRLFADLLRKGHLSRAIAGAVRTRGVFYQGPLGRIARHLLRPLIEPLVPPQLKGAIDRVKARLPRWAGPKLAGSASPVARARPLSSSQGTPSERYGRLIHGSPLASGAPLRLQQEVLGGYTMRAPLFDDDLLRFAATLPPFSLLRGGYLRGLMRESMRSFVPEDVRLRETKGAWYWFIQQTIDLAGGLGAFAELVDVRMLAELGLVEPAPFRALFEDSARFPMGADYKVIWGVLSAEAFVRHHAGGRMASMS